MTDALGPLTGSDLKTTMIYCESKGDVAEFASDIIQTFPSISPLTMTIRPEKLGGSYVLIVTGESSVVTAITNFYSGQGDT